MEYTRLGLSGLKVSRLCLGVMTYGDPAWRPWILSEEAGRPFIKRALELGINFFDTADMYSGGRSEENLGRALKDFATRDKVVVATKVYYPMSGDPNDRGLSRKHLMSSIDGSLRRLGMDYVDLYQLHRWDAETPIEETLRALDDIVRSGKARYIGASSMMSWQFAKALYLADRHGWTRFVSMQNHYNLVYREEEREMMPLCREEGIGVIPWSPLARGFLAGNRKRGAERTASPREQSDAFAHDLVLHRCRPRRGRSRRGGREDEGRGPRAGRARVAPAQARRDRADHRRVKDGTARAGGRRARRHPHGRGNAAARRTLSASPGPGDVGGGGSEVLGFWGSAVLRFGFEVRGSVDKADSAASRRARRA